MLNPTLCTKQRRILVEFKRAADAGTYEVTLNDTVILTTET